MHHRRLVIRERELVHDLLCSCFKTLIIKFFCFVDQRVDNEYLPSLGDLVFHEPVHCRAFTLGGVDGLDRLSSRRKFVYHGYIQIAIQSHGERPRDRRSRHHEDMWRRLAGRLPPQLRPLLDAESVLFVNDRQAQVVEDHIVFYQCMGTYDYAYASVLQTGVDFAPL